jgi:thymidylate synthase ThyX
MAERFPTSGVLLISVGEGHIGPLLHVIQRTIIGRNMLDKRAAEGGIHEAKGLARATISSGGKSIFPRLAEEIESNHTEVKNHSGSGLVVIKSETHCQRVEDGDFDGPDSGGSRV